MLMCLFRVIILKKRAIMSVRFKERTGLIKKDEDNLQEKI